jgi:hypothetical protein
MVVTTFKCCKNRLNQIASCTTAKHVIYYASIVDGAIQGSFFAFPSNSSIIKQKCMSCHGFVLV